MTQDKNWTQLWLQYTPKKEQGNKSLLGSMLLEGFDPENTIIKNARAELQDGVRGMLGITIKDAGKGEKAGLVIAKSSDAQIREEGFLIQETQGLLTLSAADEKGVLYGVFHILRLVAMEKPLKGIHTLINPDNPLRMYNHWDNMDGSIERGYSGNSFFFEDNQVVVNQRTVDYARFAASIGINGVVINNVNVKNWATWLITDKYFEKVAKMAEIFAGYGIKFFLSLNYAATIELGGLDSADPLDERVISWWKEKMAEVFANIPNLGGFLVKADSEGRPGPFTYGRTQADGANMLAEIGRAHV